MGGPLSAIHLFRRGNLRCPSINKKIHILPFFYTQLSLSLKYTRRVSLLVRGLGGAGSVPLVCFVRSAAFAKTFLCLSAVPVLIKDERRSCVKILKKLKLSLHKFYSGTSTKSGTLKNAITNNIDAINITSVVSITKGSSLISLLLWINIICIPNKLIKVTPAPK